LGGRELPLILRGATGSGAPFLDTTKIHAEHAVARILTPGAAEQSDEAERESG